jgi:hypothetical protein
MIKDHCFSKDWIDKFKSQERYSKLNPPVLEKMIHALYLLQHMKKQGFEFIFKGGTSLIIILEEANRFSVDIDIITEHSKEEIEAFLDAIVTNSHFTGWELDEGRSYKEGVPKAHYELSYPSNINQQANYILLDVLFEHCHYPMLQEKPIAATWIETSETINITVPTAEAIAGDKLTAYAPLTTGIPYGKGKETEIIKQLFDIGHLFDQTQNFEVIMNSFNIFVKQEIGYRKLNITAHEVLWNIINTSKLISLREKNKQEPEKTHFLCLQKGIASFTNFLISGSFRIEQAINAGAKAAYLAAKILTGNITPITKYVDEDISTLEIKSPQWNSLNRLKKLQDKSAFFYWYQTLQLLDLVKEPAVDVVVREHQQARLEEN